MEAIVIKRLQESVEAKQLLLQNKQIIQTISQLAQTISDCIRKGGKLILCGNGGSASDALHFAGEIVGRFQKERQPWPAVVLNADVATMTAIANDYGYDEVFARQAKAHLMDKDVFVGISTSGNSKNVIRATEEAKIMGVKTGALLGGNGGRIGELVDYPITVPLNKTARIQECHITIIHILCELIEDNLSDAYIDGTGGV